ncbi:MAG: hypothetical protein JWO31_717, partial [Phycisphaerales bacterium]|nr:hypothetical protein [Phycisphaerales bacterium]
DDGKVLLVKLKGGTETRLVFKVGP